MNSLLSDREVLVVEDEMLVLMNLEVALADLGCQSVTSAATEAQALALTKSHSFDVAVLDVNLDGHQSYGVADALADLGVPFVFSTGYGREGMSDNYLDRPVLKKPYRLEALANIVADLLAVKPPVA